ncbi:peptidase M24, structural domain-containing protein [Mycena albidolilacea]|uniref:Peptidase M24, structural domain-containing protein n=1 Tax=Mycena albidolilacea TaxID=1033008 RepID=A0AAD7A4H0_9AGAR|nr:peptidase M24, structural domain-containing protein [Mycena albidolilacea]
MDKGIVWEPSLRKNPNISRSRLATLFVTGACIALFYYLKAGFANNYVAPLISQHCEHLGPISAAEFQARQNSLAKTLVKLNASAYIAEPGPSSLFYGNFSNWGLSERPLLLIITPQLTGDNIEAKVSILTPAFEAPRAKMLPISSTKAVTFIEWAEEANPYEHAVSILSESQGSVFVDGHMRNFIVDGLQAAHPYGAVSSAPYEIKRLRERKSPAEIELMKCVNEATILFIRAVRKRLYFGIRESEARAMMQATFASAGLKDGGCLVLFGENAGLPHGAGTDRALGVHDFALFDCVASLHGYKSDVTRTVALPGSKIPAEHLKIWHDVRAAQTAAVGAAHEGVIAAEVDKAARASLNSEYFTHRLGHGIGLEVHEDPYLNGGSKTILETGHAFSNEPGIYQVGKVGVRLEDCFYVHENGSAVFLTAGVGGQAKSPWSP